MFDFEFIRSLIAIFHPLYNFKKENKKKSNYWRSKSKIAPIKCPLHSTNIALEYI